MRISIDYDGTLMNPLDTPPGYKLGNPFPDAKDSLKALRKKGHKIIIYTVRGNQKYLRDWFKFFEIPFDSITNEKPDAEVYVDNKSIRFDGDWLKTLALLKVIAGDK